MNFVFVGRVCSLYVQYVQLLVVYLYRLCLRRWYSNYKKCVYVFNRNPAREKERNKEKTNSRLFLFFFFFPSFCVCIYLLLFFLPCSTQPARLQSVYERAEAHILSEIEKGGVQRMREFHQQRGYAY